MAGPIQSSEDFDYEFTPKKSGPDDAALPPALYVTFVVTFCAVAAIVVAVYFLWRTGRCRSKCRDAESPTPRGRQVELTLRLIGVVDDDGKDDGGGTIDAAIKVCRVEIKEESAPVPRKPSTNDSRLKDARDSRTHLAPRSRRGKSVEPESPTPKYKPLPRRQSAVDLTLLRDG